MASPLKGVDPGLNPAVAEIEKKTGPNQFVRMMAHRPEAMQHFLALYKAVMGAGGVLERRIKEMTYVAVSHVNECAYCTNAHLKAGRAAGLSDNEIHGIETENDESFTPKERAALRYARELTRTADVDDEARYAVEELFSPDERVELTMVVCMANFTNRFNNGLGTPLEK